MGIVKGIIAFFEALDGGRTEPGPAPATPAPPVVQQPAPLVEILTAHATRLASVEGSLEGIKTFVKAESDRVIRAAESERRAVQRAVKRIQEGGEFDDADSDVSEHDEGAGRGQAVLPMHGRVESPIPDGEAVRAAARRALSIGN